MDSSMLRRRGWGCAELEGSRKAKAGSDGPSAKSVLTRAEDGGGSADHFPFVCTWDTLVACCFTVF